MEELHQPYSLSKRETGLPTGVGVEPTLLQCTISSEYIDLLASDKRRSATVSRQPLNKQLGSA